MALLGAAQVACPFTAFRAGSGCNRRVEFAQPFDSRPQVGAQDAVVDADGDIRHHSGLYVARNCDTVTNTVWISTIGSPVSGEGVMFPCASW